MLFTLSTVSHAANHLKELQSRTALHGHRAIEQLLSAEPTELFAPGPFPQRRVDAVCDHVVGDVKAEFPALRSCHCGITSGTIQATASMNITCDACEMCSLGVCVTAKASANATVKSGQTFAYVARECWKFSSGNNGDLCVTDFNGLDCDVSVGTQSCTDCSVQECNDGSLAMVADCTNVGGQVMSACDSSFTAKSTSSPFIVFDDKFQYSDCFSNSSAAFQYITNTIIALTIGSLWMML